METDSAGCPRSRRVILLDLSGTSGQNKAAISLALEEVFAICRKPGKPMAAEDIGDVKRKAERYSTKKNKNRAISMFASSTTRQLLESKSYKYSVNYS